MIDVVSSKVEYQLDNKQYLGYLSYDQNISGKQYPGIILIHEWWGLNDYIRQRTDMLAKLGYCALAIDMYGNGKIAQNPIQAETWMNSTLTDIELFTEKLKAGYQQIIKQPQVNPNKTAVIGYCFGGAMALHMARIGMPISVAVSFHGSLEAFFHSKPNKIHAQILVFHGKKDSIVSMDSVDTFRKEMDLAKADYEVIIYDNALHGFTSKEADQNRHKYGIPLGYNAQADQDSWKYMINLLENSFKV